MKILSIAIVLSIAGVMSLPAQTAPEQANIPEPTAYALTTRDGNSQVWQRTTYEIGPDGKIVPRLHQYTELATGLNHLVAGQWVPSDETITILPNGTAAAINGQHQAYFPSDIYNGEIKLITPDGKVLQSQPTALSYDDGSNTVLIAVLTNAIGQLVSSNQIVYPNAFVGINADLRYTYTKAGFEQDVVLHEQPPAPASLGLNPDTTSLQVMTEFFNPPAPVIHAGRMLTSAGELTNDQLGFGQMQMVQGKAFSLGTNLSPVPVDKQWLQMSGRQFLVEEVPTAAMAADLENLPAAVNQTRIIPPLRVATGHLTLPAQHLARATHAVYDQSIQLAEASLPKHGLVLDYQAVNSGSSNFVFQCDTTYYLSGSVSLYGTSIFEGGTVLKYVSGATLNVNMGANSYNPIWLGSTYRPVVFTAKDDNTVGEAISGSTGSPSGYYAAIALNFDGNQSPVSNFRIAYAQQAIQSAYSYSQGAVFSNGQLINCQNGIEDYSTQVSLRNVLFANVKTNFNYVSNGTIDSQNVTFSGATYLASGISGSTSLSLENCVLANITTLTNTSTTLSGTNNGFFNCQTFGVSPVTNTFYPFKTAGAGSYYLTNGCYFHNAGTINVDPALLASLTAKTTYPPIVYSNITLSASATNFSPQAQRDNTGNPDLGYHYDPVDYFFGGVKAATNLTFTAGTVMGWFELPGNGGPGYGISLPNYVSLNFNGVVTSPCVEARYDTVQEGGNGNWKDHGWLAGIIGAGSSSSVSAASVVNAAFTHFAMLNNDPNQVRDYNAVLVFRPTDCEFWSGGFGGYIISEYLTNCLFDRGILSQISGTAGNVVSVVNCTFHGGSISMTTSTPFPINIQNCALDGTVISCTGYGANSSYATYNYNAYTNSSDPFPLGGANDVHVSGSFNWQSSWFGNYYQTTNSPLINMGSTTADQVGLYHYTTQTNQMVEGNSIVDIGYHYVATDAYGNPLDSNGDGIPDYLEDANGDGLFDAGDLGEWQISPYGLSSGNALQVFTPLK